MNFAFAAILGGLAGGALMWLATRPADPLAVRSVADPGARPGWSEEMERPFSADVGDGDLGDGMKAPLPDGVEGIPAESRAPASSAPGRMNSAPGRVNMGAIRAALPAEATVIHDVVVPVPSEIFHALDKIAKPDWVEVLRPVKAGLYPKGTPEEIALMLGAVIAEGFIAVEAENASEVTRIGRSVLTLSDALGIRNSVVRRSDAILEAADARNWRQVRKELDGALFDVRGAMVELQSQGLAQLVSLGGWLRGMEALATVVDRRYTADSAELLHQRGLVDHFDRQLGKMRRDLGEGMSLARMRQGLAEIGPLMGTGSDVPTPERVRRIRDISAWLVPFIY